MLPYTTELIEVLRAHATDKEPKQFDPNFIESPGGLVFLKTSQGRYGTAWDKIQPGDIVAVLFGSRVPFILRKHGSAYRLVSSCYLEGFMHGKAIDMWKKGELNEESFDIR